MSKRIILHPIKHHDIWHIVERTRAHMWTADEIKLDIDIDDWKNASKKTRDILTHILAFFATADNLVNENIELNFGREFDIKEIESWYNLQIYQETIHAEVYSKIIHEYYGSKSRDILDKHMKTSAVANKNDWVMKWMDSTNRTLAERLAAFICIEGVIFPVQFKFIDYICESGKFPGLRQSNELIARDESWHMKGGVLLLMKYVTEVLSQEKIEQIWKEAIEIEEDFIKSALPEDMDQLSSNKMIQYLHFVGDIILGELNYKPIYKESNPFKEMTILGMFIDEKQFEITTTNYTVEKDKLISKSEDYDTLYTLF